MPQMFPTFTDLQGSRERIVRASFGMIESSAGEFRFVQLRPWPKLISGIEAMWLGGWSHGRNPRDRVRMYWSQPMGHRNYLALSYAVSELGTSPLTMRAALKALDEIAEIKRSDAILCQATNKRLTDRVMHFWGYERHLEHRRGRHYIRRFYGVYPRQTSSTRDGMVVE